MNYDNAYWANWLIFITIFLIYLDPFDFSGDDDDDKDSGKPPVDPPVDPDKGERIIGSDEPDEITGTARADELFGMGGADTVTGNGGNDSIEGNTANDVLYGGDGNDCISGGAGSDLMEGGAGNDTIATDRLDQDAEWERGGNETLSGGEGDDQLYFWAGDSVTGGEGKDFFNMVVPEKGDPAKIDDFEPENDKITLFATYDATKPPDINFSIDSDNNETKVFLGDQHVVTMKGTFSKKDVDITLRPEDEVFT